LFPSLTQSIGFHGLFWIYSAFSQVDALYGYICIPETIEKSLKEIENHFLEIDKLDKVPHQTEVQPAILHAKTMQHHHDHQLA
jgi:hypothetical protein